MNRSVLIAVGIALVATLWIVSGMLGGGPADEDAATQAQGVSPSQQDDAQAQAPKRVRVRDSVAQPMHASLDLYGQTKALQDVVLRAETSGPVVALLVEKGQVVEEGQELIRLGEQDRPARLAEAKARVAQMSLKYQQASRLARNDFASRSTVAEARANLENAQANLALIEEEIEDTVIRAPFSGVFDENSVEVGDTVSVGSELGRLVRLDPLTVMAEVAEQSVDRIAPQGEAVVTLISGRQVSGQVSWVAKVASEGTRTYRVEVKIPNPDNAISAGMTARVALPLAPVQAHLVSPSALTLDDMGRIGVKAMDDTNHVHFYEVRPVEDGTGGMWIAGLPEKLRLITVGQDYVTVGGTAEPVVEDAPLVPLGDDQNAEASAQGVSQ